MSAITAKDERVSARSNRKKGDQDTAHWLPDTDRCGNSIKWVSTKAKYHLTVDQAEHEPSPESSPSAPPDLVAGRRSRICGWR